MSKGRGFYGQKKLPIGIEAPDQINEHNYTAELKEDDMHTILKYGIACYKKQCRVVLERE